MSSYDYDEFDLQILQMLQENCRQPQARMASEVGLSAPAVNDRIRKMEQAGVIRKYTALIDHRKAACDVTAFIEVYIDDPKREEEFLHGLENLDAVQECHHVTGEFSFLLKVKTLDIGSLENLVLRHINSYRGVQRTKTIVVLSTQKEETKLDLTGIHPRPPRRSKPD